MTAAWTALAWAGGEVLVVLSEDSAPYREVAEAVRSGLADNGVRVSVRVLPATGSEIPPRQDLQAVVTVGARAARELAKGDPRVPVLATLLPRAAFNRIAVEAGRAGDTRHFSAVFQDQPLARQFELIRQALPGVSRVALLLGPESQALYPSAQLAAAERGLRVSAQKAASEAELYPALERLLSDADVLLALPDPAVFTSGAVPYILLTTYRQRLPVVGFSAAYARAGAVVSLHSTPAQIGDQAAEIVRGALATHHLPPPRHPRYFTVSVNGHVARSLGIALEDEATLTLRLQLTEFP